MAQQQQLNEARELLRTGRYEAALARLVDCGGWPSPQLERAELLRAEILLRRDPVDALEALARSSDLLQHEDTRFQYFIVSGLAYSNARNFEGASEMFARARHVAGNDQANLATLAHQRSRLRYLRGEFDPQDPDFAVALTHPDAGSRMSTLTWRSWMHAGLGNYRAQIADLRASLALAREHPDKPEHFTIGRALHSL
ncbi:MAG TPA: hypothetical protein VF741_07635, partial [Candidatus Aquilonibacter sp.]